MDAVSVTTARTVIRAPQLEQCFTSMSKVRRNTSPNPDVKAARRAGSALSVRSIPLQSAYCAANFCS